MNKIFFHGITTSTPSNLITKNAQQTQHTTRQYINIWVNQSFGILKTMIHISNKGTEGTQQSIHLSISLQKRQQTIPFQVYEKTSENDLKRYKALTSGSIDSGALYKAEILRKQALNELEGTPLHELLERPNPSQSYNSFLTELIAFRKLTGNVTSMEFAPPKTGMNQGRYSELYVMPSQVMEIVSGGFMQPSKRLQN